MATLAQLAQFNPQTMNQDAGQDWLSSAGLDGMTPEQIIALLSQQDWVSQDYQNPQDAIVRAYSDLEGPQTMGYQRTLTPTFDPSQGGTYGHYVADYDPQGNFTGVRQLQDSRDEGSIGDWLAENGWMVPLAAAGIGATMMPGAGTGLEGQLFGGFSGGSGSGTLAGGAGGDTLGAGSGITAGAGGAGGGGLSASGSSWMPFAAESLPATIASGLPASVPSTLGALAKYLPYISAGTSLVSGLGGAYAAGKAADAQVNAANAATDLQKSIYDQTRADYAPWLEAGKQGLGALTGNMSQWTTPFTGQDIYRDPSYDFRFNEGQRAVENSASARGQLLSGQHLKDLVNYGQNMASTEYGNAFNRYETATGNQFNRLAGIAGIGQAAQGTVSNAGQNFGQLAGSNMGQAANSRASGYVGAAGSLTNAGNSMLNNWMQQQWLGSILGGK